MSVTDWPRVLPMVDADIVMSLSELHLAAAQIRDDLDQVITDVSCRRHRLNRAA